MTKRKKESASLSKQEKNERDQALTKWWEKYMGLTESKEKTEEQKKIVHEAKKRKDMKVEDLAIRLVKVAKEAPKIHEEYKEKMADLENSYINEALNEKIIEVQKEENAKFTQLLEGWEEEVRYMAEVLRSRVEEAYTVPITSEIMIQLEALSQVKLSESEFRLYFERYQGIPLAMKMLAEIANNQGIKTKVFTLDDYMKQVKLLVREFDGIIQNIRNRNFIGVAIGKNLILEKCVSFNRYMDSLVTPKCSEIKVGNLRSDYFENNYKGDPDFEKKVKDLSDLIDQEALADTIMNKLYSNK